MPLKSCGGPIGREPVPGILPKQPAEGGKQVRMVSRKVVRTCEETLGCYSEKLRVAGRPVMIEKRLLTSLGKPQQALELNIGDLVPPLLELDIGHRRNTVDATVEPVHVMGEFMENQVPAP